VAHATGAHADAVRGGEVRGGEVNLQGTKAWCSGAGVVTHALISAWNTDRQPVLVAADLRQPSVSIDEDGWRAVGMGRSGSYSVILDGAVARRVGAPGAYVARPGFLQGGAGVAACWYGGLEGIAQALRRSLDQKAGRSASEAAAPPELAHALAHLGAVDVALTQARASLREAAHHIDSHPDRPAPDWLSKPPPATCWTACRGPWARVRSATIEPWPKPWPICPFSSARAMRSAIWPPMPGSC